MKPTTKHVVVTMVVLLAAVAAALPLFAWSGVYDIAADDPHTAPVTALLTTLRDRSVETRAGRIPVPDLTRPEAVLQGAGNYEAMCSGCHLAPGVDSSELSRGLYPAPPNLAKHQAEPAFAFWVIKHGIKASGMPAWGKSMDDDVIWNLTAFLQELPKLDAGHYREMVARSGGHEHGDGAGSAEAGMAGHHREGKAGRGGEGEKGDHAGGQDAHRPAPASAPAAGTHKDDGHHH